MAFPASAMRDSHYAKGISQGHQWENIQEETRRAARFWKAAAHTLFLNVTQSRCLSHWDVTFTHVSDSTEVNCFRFSTSPAPTLKHGTTNIITIYLYFTWISPLSALLKDPQNIQMWQCFLGEDVQEEDVQDLPPRLRSRNRIHRPQAVSHSTFASLPPCSRDCFSEKISSEYYCLEVLVAGLLLLKRWAS